MQNIFESTPEDEVNILDPYKEEGLRDLVTILKKRARQRQDSELLTLYYVLKDIPFFANFFKQYPPEYQIYLVKEVQYEFVQKGKPVFLFGDIAKNFYVVLRGSVGILLPSKEEKMEVKTYHNSLTKKDSNLGESMVMDNKEGSLNNSKEQIESLDDHKLEMIPVLSNEILLSLYPNHTIVNSFKRGDYFGEIALTLHTTRTASVIAYEDSHFLILGAGPYRRVLSIKDYNRSLLDAIMKLLRSNPLTSFWPLENLNGLLRQSTEARFLRNHVIYDFGDFCENVYFIKEGEIELSKEVQVDLGNLEGDDPREKTVIDANIKRESIFTINGVWKGKLTKLARRCAPCAVLCKNQGFGEEESLNKELIRRFRAIVKSTTAELMIIPLSKFFENAPKGFHNELKKRDLKSEWREQVTREPVFEDLPNEAARKKELAEKISQKIIKPIQKKNFKVMNIQSAPPIQQETFFQKQQPKVAKETLKRTTTQINIQGIVNIDSASIRKSVYNKSSPRTQAKLLRESARVKSITLSKASALEPVRSKESIHIKGKRELLNLLNQEDDGQPDFLKKLKQYEREYGVKLTPRERPDHNTIFCQKEMQPLPLPSKTTTKLWDLNIEDHIIKPKSYPTKASTEKQDTPLKSSSSIRRYSLPRQTITNEYQLQDKESPDKFESNIRKHFYKKMGISESVLNSPTSRSIPSMSGVFCTTMTSPLKKNSISISSPNSMGARNSYANINNHLSPTQSQFPFTRPRTGHIQKTKEDLVVSGLYLGYHSILREKKKSSI